MPILLSHHNPLYASQFRTTKSELAGILRGIPILSIEHVGSTSIPGLIAKPILDIDIVVSPSSLAATRAALVGAGYQDLGDLGLEGRFAFRQPSWDGEREGKKAGKAFKENTYVCIEGCLSLRNHRDVKRVLLEDEGLRREYGECKVGLVGELERGVVELGGEKGDEMDYYVRGKTEVLGRVLRRAGWSEGDVEEVRRVNE